MSLLLPVLRNRWFWWLVVISVLSLILGHFVPSPEQALNWARVTGYWFMLAMLLVGGLCLVRLFAAGDESQRGPWRNVWLWAVVALTTLGWHAHERFEFKVLADEALLAGTAQNLHLMREVGYPVRTTTVRGPFEVLQTNIDKRPVCFPFLVSVLHDWTGYRVSNAFLLNATLGVVFLCVTAGVAHRVGGSKWAAPVAVGWLAGIPLLAQQASGGGFELLNLTLLAAWVWLAMVYADSPSGRTQDAFVLVAVMLGSTRYESLLYLVPTAGLMVWTWARNRNVIFSLASWVAPVLLLPTLWLNQAFKQNADFWEMKSVGADHPFGLDYVSSNLGHALAHFLSIDGYQPNSPVFGLLGLLAIPFLMLWVLKKLRSPGEVDGQDAGLLAGIFGLTGGTLLMMLYFWGQFDHPVIHRLSLPTQLLMWLALIILTRQLCLKWPWVWRASGGLAAATLLIWTLPVMSRNAYSREYTPGLAYAWRQEFFERLKTRNILFIDRDSLFWTIREVSATPIMQAQARKEGIAYHFRNQSFDDVYAFQTFTVDRDSGKLSLVPQDDLGPGYELETVIQHRLAIGLLARISRITAVRAESGPVEEAGARESSSALPAGPVSADIDTDLKKGEAARLKKWVENLP